jgi:predicted AlkP superfamily pyrophosphatase or phosphodiesterase
MNTSPTSPESNRQLTVVSGGHHGRATWPLLLLLGLGLVGSAMADSLHVVIVGVDGMSPDGVRRATTPAMDRLMREGSVSLTARAVMPTSSSPNWASMIMGAGPEQHGITSNDWRPDKHDLPPTTRGSGGIFPTIFSVLRDQRPDALIACFYDWSGFGRLVEAAVFDRLEDTEGPTNTVRRAVAYWARQRPTLTFLHLDHVDGAGHKYGHGTPEYYASVEAADQLIGEVIAGLEAAGMWERTILLVTSDHGGINKGHGGATLAEVEIPWMIRGPGIRAGHVLTVPINIYDTAATAAHALGLRMPDGWIARPVLQAFGPGVERGGW